METYRVLIKTPALSMAPDNLARESSQAGETVLERDHIRLQEAENAQQHVIGQFKGMMRNVRDVQGQDYWLGSAAVASLLTGMLLHIPLAGPIARALPASWLMPEKIAAEALDMPQWEAGAHLMAITNPEGWQRLVRAGTIVADNREALDACQRKKRASNGGDVRCTITVKAEK